MVAASQPLAASAGIEILQRGGSAADAAIAVSAVLCVVEPGASHLGGDAFVITHNSSDRTNLAFNGSGEAPHNADAQQYPRGIDTHGFRAATVPGLVSTWFSIHEKFGSLAFAELLGPAIRFANSGFPASEGFVRRIKRHLQLYPDTKLFKDLGFSENLAVGELVLQPALAKSLQLIARDGRSAFYHGEIAQALISATNGWFSEEDLARHHTRVLPPLTVDYRGYQVHGQPPPSQGMILMQELRIAEGFDLAGMNEAQRIHTMVEAKKIAFYDRFRILGDPEQLDVNVFGVLNDDHISTCRGSIDPNLANINPSLENQEGSDTTYFLVADKDGNALSWIQSVFHGFGASWAIPETGIILNNRLTGFSLNPSSPNFIAPGKRPAHTLNAWTMTRNDGSLAYVGGTPGANVQVQTNFQLIVNAVDLLLNPQQNAEAPRWQHLNKPGESYLDSDDVYGGVLELENRYPAETQEELRGKGHQVNLLSDYGQGSAVQLMQVLENGTFVTGSDPRCEGQAIGI